MSEMGEPVPASREAYALPTPIADARIDELPAGANLLVAGPARTRKRALALNFLAHSDQKNQPAILVTTDKSASRLVNEYRDTLDREMPPTYVVDCTGSTTRDDLPFLAHVEKVSSPGDLTGVGIGIAKSMKAAGDEAAAGLRFAHISLSTLLQYSEASRVFRFAHVVGGRIAAAHYLGVWTLDTNSHEETTVNTLRGRFEYVAEIRETDDGGREMRVLGGPEEWRTWTGL